MAPVLLNVRVVVVDTFAAALKRFRERAGLTQERLAEGAGLSTNAVSALERGARRRPYPHTVRALAEALRLTAQERAELDASARAAQPPARQPELSRLPAPRQLPAVIANFTGRTGDLARLDALLAAEGEPHRSVVISAIGGTAGVGKTTLALAWAHRVRDQFPDGQLYVNLRGYDPGAPAGPAEVLDGFLRAFDVPVEKIPPGVEQRAALFRSLVDGARLLVVLDNANSAEQVRPLLPGSPSALVIVTSRASLTGLAVSAGAVRLSLDLLSAEDADGLLRSIVGDARADAEPGAMAELARLCARLPLALQLGGQRAAARPELPLAELVADLADESQRLELLSHGADESTAMRAVFSWSYRNLTEQQARLFGLLGLHPGQEFDAHTVAALAGLAPAQVRRLLHDLADAHLVEPVGAGRYRMHDLLRAYARERAEAEPRTTELHRLVGFYVHTSAAADHALHPGRGRAVTDGAAAPEHPVEFADYDEALRWCERELSNVVAVTRLAAECGLHAAAWQIPNNLWSFFYLTKHRTEWTETHRIGRHAAERAGDTAGRVRMLNGLSAVASHQEALDLLDEALPLFRTIGDERGEGAALVNLGHVTMRLHRYDESIEYSMQALKIARGAGHQYVEGAAVCNLAEAYLELHRYAEAVDSFEQALELCRLTGNRVGEGGTLVHLGASQLGLRHYDEATRYLTRGLEVCRENGDRHGEARALASLGHVYKQTGGSSAARRCWETALELFDALDDERAAELRGHLSGLAEPRAGRRPARSTLTPAEERIAALVAGGLTNREVATVACLSPKTVEVNLSRIYRKLGVRNRTELANHITAGTATGAEV